MRSKVMLSLVVLLAVVLGAPRAVAGQSSVPAGYFLAPPTLLPDSLVESRTGGLFRIEVLRVAPDSGARRALILAESVFPEAARIEEMATRETLAAVKERLQEAARLSGPRWWWDEFDEVLTPYAVTGAAVEYYLARIRSRSDGPNPFVKVSEGRAHNGTFSYRASVSPAPINGVAAGGHVVRLTLRWHYWCGMLCAVTFGANREVVISKDGRVLEVRGDGRPLLIVS